MWFSFVIVVIVISFLDLAYPFLSSLNMITFSYMNFPLTFKLGIDVEFY